MAGTVEQTYAQALLEIGCEDNSLGELYEEITALVGIFGESRDFARLLSSPSVTVSEKTELIRSVFEGRISDSSLNFLCVLAMKNRLEHLPGIAAELKRGYYEETGIAEVTVITAVPMNDGERERLTGKLSKKYGRTVVLDERVDPDIIGGMIIIYRNNMLDGSVRTRLKNMRRQIGE